MVGVRRWRQSLSPRITLAIIGLGVALSLAGDSTLYVVLATHTTAAGILLTDVGLMLSANRLVRLPINTPVGLLLERLPRRGVLVPALFLGGFSTLLYTIPGFWTLLLGRLLWGLAWAGVWLGASTAVLDLTDETNRGQFSGQLQSWFFLGVGLSSILGGLLTDQLGYSTALLICAGLTLSAALIWLIVLPETRPAGQPGESTAREHSPAHPLQAQPEQGGATRTLFTAIGVLGLNWLIFMGLIGATLPLLLQERIGDSLLLFSLTIPLSTVTGTLTAASQGSGLLAAAAAGWLSDRSSRRWGLILMACVAGVLALVLIAVGGPGIVIAAVLLGASATSVMQTQVMTLIGDRAGARRGRLLGITNTIGDLGSALAPLLAYMLLPGIGLSGLFWLAAALLVCALPLIARASQTEWRPAQPVQSAAD